MSSALPNATNYHGWIMDCLKKWLPPGRILEAGMGYGQYTHELAKCADQVVAVDIDPAMVDAFGEPSINLKLDVADIRGWDFAERVGEENFDAVVCLNVLEHVHDHGLALQNMRRVLVEGGLLLLLVPAHRALFGPMDRQAGHYRRYTRRGMASLLKKSCYKIEEISYFNPLGGVGWWVNSQFYNPSDLSAPGVNWQILFFDHWLLPVSRLLNPITRGCFGQSLWAVARKKMKQERLT